jgi:hypothetical protein
VGFVVDEVALGQAVLRTLPRFLTRYNFTETSPPSSADVKSGEDIPPHAISLRGIVLN